MQNLKTKKWRDLAYYVTPSEKVGDTCPPSPPPNCVHANYSNENIIRKN